MRNWIDLFEAALKLSGGADTPESPANRFLKTIDDATDPHPFDNRSRLHGMVALTLSRSVDDRQKGVRINDIQSLEMNRGHAKSTMAGLCETADECGVFLELTAKAYSERGMTTAQLVKWYEGFGFVISGEFGDDHDGYDMVRQPRLTESTFYRGDFKPRYATEPVDITILKNPSKGELKRMFAKVKPIPYSGKEIRGLLTDTELLIWDSSIAEHAAVTNVFSLKGMSVYFYEGGFMKMDDYYLHDPEMKADAIEHITNHPAILRLGVPNPTSDSPHGFGFTFQ